MRNILFIIIFLLSEISYAEIRALQEDFLYQNEEIKINANLYTSPSVNKNIIILSHGTRGHQNMEIIKSFSTTLNDNGFDVLTPNYSFGISNRDSIFLPCDIRHTHISEMSIKEIIHWFNYAIKNNYQRIIFAGHSRGGQDTLNAYKYIKEYLSNYQEYIDSLILLAPLTDSRQDNFNKILNESNVNLTELSKLDKNQFIKSNFLMCENADVKISSLLSYYDILSEDESIQILLGLNKPVYIFTAMQDSFVPETYERLKEIDKNNIKLFNIEDSDHFFRDLYLDEIIDYLIEFIE